MALLHAFLYNWPPINLITLVYQYLILCMTISRGFFQFPIKATQRHNVISSLQINQLTPWNWSSNALSETFGRRIIAKMSRLKLWSSCSLNKIIMPRRAATEKPAASIWTNASDPRLVLDTRLILKHDQLVPHYIFCVQAYIRSRCTCYVCFCTLWA